MKRTNVNPNTGMLIPITYLVLFLVSGEVLYLANMFFPELIVLGTAHLNATWGIVLSMGALSLINLLALPFIRRYENMRDKMFTVTDWMTTYFFLNFIGVWLISRAAEQFGLGISSWIVVAALALVLDVAQGIALQLVEKFRVQE